MASTKWYAVALVVVSVVILIVTLIWGLGVFSSGAILQKLSFVATQIGFGGSVALFSIGSLLGVVGLICGILWCVLAKLKEAEADEADSPLHRAVILGNVNEIKKLIEQGADINEKDSFRGLTPLISAIINRNPKALKTLLDKGADRNTGVSIVGGHPLVVAVYWNSGEALEILLENGADVNSQFYTKESKGGYSLCHLAILYSSLKMLKTLLAKGANVNSRDAEGKTPLHKAVESDRDEASSFVQELITGDADMNIRDNDGRTALYLAAENNQTHLVKMLMQSGADPYIPDNTGMTPFRLCAESRHLETLQWFQLHHLTELHRLTGNPFPTNLSDADYNYSLGVLKHESQDFLR